MTLPLRAHSTQVESLSVICAHASLAKAKRLRKGGFTDAALRPSNGDPTWSGSALVPTCIADKFRAGDTTHAGYFAADAFHNIAGDCTHNRRRIRHALIRNSRLVGVTAIRQRP